MSLTHLASVDSTNDWLLARAGALADGHWVIADRQTAGRGRRGRAWSDGAGNLMASVLVRSDGPVQQLSFVAAVALRTALVSASTVAIPHDPREVAARATAGACLEFAWAERGGDSEAQDLSRRLNLKWPNDLLLDGKKLSGILLERNAEALVIGFGVNLASAPEFAASLPDIAPLDLLQALINAFAEYRALWTTQGFAPIRTRWLEAAAGLGTRITARLGTETLEGMFEGLEPDGALALRLDSGQLRAIHAGEVFAL